MKIGLIGAIEEEVILLRNKIKNCQIFSSGSCKIYTGILNGTKIVLVKSGIGKVAAALGTTLILERFQPDIIINLGTAASLASKLKIGDIVVSDKVCYHDVDVTVFGYEYGQLPGYPLSFKADEKLISLTEDCISDLKINVIRGLIISGDAFINSSLRREEICQNFPEAIAVEMEATAIGHVCYNFKVPFVVVRAISDIADQWADLSFENSLLIAAKQSSLVVETLIQKLAYN